MNNIRKTLLMNNSIQNLDKWLQKLGNIQVITDSLEILSSCKNISEFPAVPPIAILKPQNSEEVEKITNIANDIKTPLYVYSTGKNWGLGSKAIPSSVDSDYVMVDLSEMRKIHELNLELGYAVIDAGVTQGQLSEMINKNHSTSFVLNVTGSSADTSIVGNMLDRGSGVLGNRMEDFLGLEVILGDGTLIKTGLWELYETKNLKPVHCYTHGIGPDCSHLFFQSNFGIVTKMVVKLRRKVNREAAFILLKDYNLSDCVDKVRILREEDTLNSIIKIDDISNDFRFWNDKKSHLQSTSGEFMITANIHGSENIISAKKVEIQQRLSSLAKEIIFIKSAEDSDNTSKLFKITNAYNKESLAYHFDRFNGHCIDSNVNSLFKLYNKKEFKSSELDLNSNASGLVCLVPTIPFCGSYIFPLQSI